MKIERVREEIIEYIWPLWFVFGFAVPLLAVISLVWLSAEERDRKAQYAELRYEIHRLRSDHNELDHDFWDFRWAADRRLERLEPPKPKCQETP